MSIQSVGGYGPGVTAVGAATPMSMTSPAPTPALNGTLSGIAQQLGMSTGSVQSALRQGRSITQLAAQQGVARSALVNAVQAQIQSARHSAGQPPADPTILDRMVNRAFDRHIRA